MAKCERCGRRYRMNWVRLQPCPWCREADIQRTGFGGHYSKRDEELVRRPVKVTMSVKLKIILNLISPGEEGGTVLFDDGSKAFWNEGRDGVVQVHRANGKWEELSPGEDYDNNPIIMGLEFDTNYDYPTRPMTMAEEIEWKLARNGFKQ